MSAEALEEMSAEAPEEVIDATGVTDDANEPEADQADEPPRSGPLRRCVATGVVADKSGMIRFVAAPDGQVVFDLEEKLPGRGMWLTADRAALTLALKKNAFSRSARRSLKAGDDLAANLEAALIRRCLERVGLARRAGQLVAGYDKVREALKTRRVGRSGTPGLLIAAADGSPEQRGKVAALAPRLPVLDAFTGAELASALGRDTTVHAVVAEGALAKALCRDAARLAGIRHSVVGPARPDTVTTHG